MSPAGALLVTHLQETFTTKYNVLFTLWPQTLLFNDVKVTVHFSWFLHSAYLVKQASVLLHILLTQPRRPLTFFFYNWQTSHSSINRKTVMQTIKFLFTLARLMKCNLVLKTFLEHIPSSIPSSACCHGCAIGFLPSFLYFSILSLNYYCLLLPLY